MLKNYIKTTFRNLLRNKVNALINIFGLSMGLGCAIVLLLLADYHTSFDDFHTNKDRIFRVVSSSDGQGGQRDHTTGVPTPFPDAMRNDFPELEEVSFVTFKYGTTLVSVESYGQTKYFEEDEHIAIIDQHYLKLFDIEWLEGNKSTAMSEPNSIILSEDWVKKYFGDEPALNQTITMDKETVMVVKGVMANPPKQSDFPFHMYISLPTVKEEILSYGWGSVSSDDQCYILLSDVADTTRINAQLDEFTVKYFGEHNNNKKLALQPLSNLHSSDQYTNYNYSTTSKDNILTMRLVALFLVLTACVNFINLSTAMAVKRAREVGVRKVLGGTRSQLIKQFLGESFVIVLTAMAIALGLGELLIIYLNPFMDIALSIPISNLRFLLLAFAVTTFIAILSGFYPALVLSGFKPALAMKNITSKKSSGGMGVRKGLVIFQFFISQVFVIGTIVIISQLNFIRDQDLGFAPEAIINIEIPENNNSKKATLKTEIERMNGVEQVSLIYTNPTSGSVSVTDFHLPNSADEYLSALKYGDANYLDIFDISILEGRPLGNSDTINQIVVNEEWVKYSGMTSNDEAVGTMVRVHGREVPVVGVMQDFHSTSLRNKLTPLMLMNNINSYRRLAIKLNLSNLDQTTAQIRNTWKELFPEYDFEYRFVDDQIAEFYEGVSDMAFIFGFFSMIAILIGCLGLFGLASFMVNQKIKEIGVRKVLGASVGSILRLFSKEYFILVVVAFLFAAPIAGYIMEQWLQNFEYKINMGWVIFASGIIVTLAISMLTVSYKSIRAATANPVDSLRTE